MPPQATTSRRSWKWLSSRWTIHESSGPCN